MNWLKSLWSWLRPKLSKLFVLTAQNVAQEVLALINDAALQQKALAAVKAAAENGLKGNAAFDAALAGFTAVLKAEGRKLSTSIRETLVQNAYIVFKHTEAA